MAKITNCPNCGAPIHDYICDYCGTVFTTNLNDFDGRNAMLIAMDDDKNLLIQNLNIYHIERDQEYDRLWSDTRTYMMVPTFNKVTIIGYPYDDKAVMHHLKELKDILDKRLKM